MTVLKDKRPLILSSVALFVLIIDAKTAIHGAYDGVNLCLATIIPSLFPFFVMTAILISALAADRWSVLIPLERVLRLPANAVMIYLIGLLGGYPIGAQSIRQAYCNGQLSKMNADRMLAFCSNAGPAFIFGIGASILPEPWMCWLVWLIQVLSSLIVGLLTPSHPDSMPSASQGKTLSITEAIQRSIRVMASVCSWIVLFKILLAFLRKWFFWILPNGFSIALTGLLELANGCMRLTEIEYLPLKFCLFTVMLSGGGLCVALQTQAVLHGSGLSVRPYFRGKVLQCILSSALCIVLLPIVFQVRLPLFAILIGAASVPFCVAYYITEQKSKKGIAFRKPLMYNGNKAPGGITYETIS